MTDMDVDKPETLPWYMLVSNLDFALAGGDLLTEYTRTCVEVEKRAKVNPVNPDMGFYSSFSAPELPEDDGVVGYLAVNVPRGDTPETVQLRSEIARAIDEYDLFDTGGRTKGEDETVLALLTRDPEGGRSRLFSVGVRRLWENGAIYFDVVSMYLRSEPFQSVRVEHVETLPKQGPGQARYTSAAKVVSAAIVDSAFRE